MGRSDKGPAVKGLVLGLPSMNKDIFRHIHIYGIDILTNDKNTQQVSRYFKYCTNPLIAQVNTRKCLYIDDEDESFIDPT